jgi:pyruvate kinase
MEAMVRIILGAEKHPTASFDTYRMHENVTSADQSVALATMFTANHLSGVKAIISMTESGATPRLMSRVGSQLPIFAFSRHVSTQRKVALYRGVQPVAFDTETIPSTADFERAIEVLKTSGIVRDGDLVIVSCGDTNQLGGTNTMKILRVGGEQA